MKLASKIFRRTDWCVTSPFGNRIHPISKVLQFHAGTDYGTGGAKWALHAIEDGVVHLVGYNASAGKYMWVRYPRINRSLFMCHLDSIVVKQGQTVKEGTLLGYTGTTGGSTGVHLHLGMTAIGSNTNLDPHAYEYDGGPSGVVAAPEQPVTSGQKTVQRVYRNIKNRKPSVEEWQRVLKKAGYDIGTAGPNKDGVDGDFGTKTDTATKAYQKAKGLWVDGDVGSKTWLSAGYKCV